MSLGSLKNGLPMPAKDRYHQSVKNALIKEGWTITHDPLHLRWGRKDMYVDLGAERLFSAEKDGRHIAVEIKTFGNISEMLALEQALGQYFVYFAVIAETKPDYRLYLAIHRNVFFDVFEEPIGQLLLKKYQLSLIVFDPEQEVIIEWIQN